MLGDVYYIQNRNCYYQGLINEWKLHKRTEIHLYQFVQSKFIWSLLHLSLFGLSFWRLKIIKEFRLSLFHPRQLRQFITTQWCTLIHVDRIYRNFRKSHYFNHWNVLANAHRKLSIIFPRSYEIYDHFLQS